MTTTSQLLTHIRHTSIILMPRKKHSQLFSDPSSIHHHLMTLLLHVKLCFFIHRNTPSRKIRKKVKETELKGLSAEDMLKSILGDMMKSSDKDHKEDQTTPKVGDPKHQ